MAGLREKQKALRNRALLTAAAERFRRLGYEATRIEDIAEQAEVAVGTFYNYFGNKGDVLLAIVTLEVEEILAEGQRWVANPPEDITTAVAGLIRIYYNHSLLYLSKEMWRTAMALTIQNPDSPFSQRYTALDARLSAQVCALMQRLQDLGRIRAQASAQAAGQLLFNNLNMMFIEFVKDEAMGLEALHKTVARQNAVLLESLQGG